MSGGESAELHARLRAELVGLGWRVKEVSSGGDLALAQVARRARTLAVLRVGRSAEGIEVWVAPEVDSEARSEWVDVDATRPELAVLRAVEALRARFLELGIEPEDVQKSGTSDASSQPWGNKTEVAPKRRDAESSAKSRKRATPSEDGSELTDTDASSLRLTLPPTEGGRARHAVWLGLNGGVISASQDLGANAALSGALRYTWASWLGVDLSLWWPPVATRIRADEGYADVRATLVALGAEARDGRHGWTLAGGGGLALVSLGMDGYAQKDGYRNNSTSVFTPMPFARLAAEVELVRHLRLRAEGALGFSTQRALVRFDQNTVAIWGRPFLSASLGLSWAAVGD